MADSQTKADPPVSKHSTLLIKVGISSAVAVLIVAQLANRLEIEIETVALVVIAILPWLSTIVESIDLPGGGRVQFREVQAIVETQQKQLEMQQEIVNQLVVYSMSFGSRARRCWIGSIRR